jgi:hypothetical protein
MPEMKPREGIMPSPVARIPAPSPHPETAVSITDYYSNPPEHRSPKFPFEHVGVRKERNLKGIGKKGLPFCSTIKTARN